MPSGAAHRAGIEHTSMVLLDGKPDAGSSVKDIVSTLTDDINR